MKWLCTLKVRGIADAEPFGLLTEGAAGIATIVLAIIALAGISIGALAAITTIIIGVGLIVQAFNAAAEVSRDLNASGTASTVAWRRTELGGEVMIDMTAGLTGIVLGILGLVGINAPHLIPAALIVFGGSLILSGTIAAQGRGVGTAMTTSGAPVQVSYQGSAAIAGLEIMVGFAAAILGILTLILESSWILLLVGFIAVGAALLIVSATFSGAVVRFFTTTTA
jgi:hypothetical protein